MRYIFLFCLFAAQTFAINERDFRGFIVKWEGYTLKPYKDNHYFSVGVGHNLTANRQQIRKYSELEIEQFYINDFSKALKAARKGIPNFDSLPREAKYVTLSLIWTVGPNGFMKFKNYRLALRKRNFVLASTALRDSLWADQIGKERFKNHYNLLKNIR